MIAAAALILSLIASASVTACLYCTWKCLPLNGLSREEREAGRIMLFAFAGTAVLMIFGLELLQALK